MVLFPNGKINIGLRVVHKRTDGYHDIETVFYPVALHDVLEVIKSTELIFTCTGIPVTGPAADNLCVKAYHLLKADFPHLPPVSIHLHKTIPAGAGLGGGSADGACMLTLLNKKFQLVLSKDALIKYALRLGSDCPFFIINRPCFAAGRGENLTPVQLNLSTYKMVLVNPRIHISTKEAFANMYPAPSKDNLRQLVAQDVSAWKDRIENDFEKTVFTLYPEIEKIKNDLYNAGAVYASMTGTGSTVFGLFEMNTEGSFSFPEGYLCITIP